MKDLKITKGEMTPQKFIGERVIYDKAGQMIFGHKGDKLQLLLDVRGWGAIQHLFGTEKEAADFQDEVGEWYAAAINEKLNGGYSELLKQRDELKEALAEQKRLYFSLFDEETSCMYCEAKIRRGSAIILCKECAESTEV